VKNRINFLDVTIGLDDRRIIFDRYEKPTNTGRYINFYSQHPLSQKKSIIYGLIDRTLLLSHPKFHGKNLTHVINILLDNCFPLPFIFATIKTRIKTLINRTVNEANDNHHRSQLNQKYYFTIPYIRSISESFIPITKKFSYDIAYSIPNTMNKIIKRGKGKTEHMSINYCVYKINCLNCEKSYVGQTKRQLETRVKEHKSDITKKERLVIGNF